MEKMIVTEYGRPIMMQKVKEFTQRTMFLADEREQSHPLCSVRTARQRRNGEHRQF